MFGTIRKAGATVNLNDFLTLPVPRFLKASGLSRERFYKLVAADEIESFVLGSRRFVVVESYRRLIERQRSAESHAAATPPRRHRATIAAASPEPPAA